jgi:hypothetical protein
MSSPRVHDSARNEASERQDVKPSEDYYRDKEKGWPRDLTLEFLGEASSSRSAVQVGFEIGRYPLIDSAL